MAKGAKESPRWYALRDALAYFASGAAATQSQGHIRPLHWYTAHRLVIEGGFRPEHVTPRIPCRSHKKNGRWLLVRDESVGVQREQTIFGGLKTKDVDVTVDIPGVGPVVAVSMKGTLNAFRNLTNRMEEAAGDCTNLHLAYPGLVYAFWHVFRANIAGPAPAGSDRVVGLSADGHYKAPDVALTSDARDPSRLALSNNLARYFFAMARLSGRNDMRSEPSAYEAVGMTLADVREGHGGDVLTDHPPADSPLRHEAMFSTIYEQFDLRFVYQSPALAPKTRRLTWAEESDALQSIPGADFAPRFADDAAMEEAEAMEEHADDAEAR